MVVWCQVFNSKYRWPDVSPSSNPSMMRRRPLPGLRLVGFIKNNLFLDSKLNLIFLFVAARNSQKGSYKDKRDLVTYEEELF